MLQLHLSFYVLTGVYLDKGKLTGTSTLVYADYVNAEAHLKMIEKDFANDNGQFKLHLSKNDFFDSYATFKSKDGRYYRWVIVEKDLSLKSV